MAPEKVHDDESFRVAVAERGVEVRQQDFVVPERGHHPSLGLGEARNGGDLAVVDAEFILVGDPVGVPQVRKIGEVHDVIGEVFKGE